MGIHNYLVLCKKYGMPKVNYTSHSNHNLFVPNIKSVNTKKYLGRVLIKQDAAVKKFLKS